MCGICGIVDLERRSRVERGRLADMAQQIVHRGPDDEGFYIDGNVGLAMRRLSIVDLQTGHQPLSNEDGSIWLVYNGEIYNHQDLRRELSARGHVYRTRSDTETILHLYEEYGRDCVHHLRGMFAFALWDRRNRRLFAARDRLGIKPFYYWYDGGKFLFGSEIKTLLADPGIKSEFNTDTLSEYLAFGYLAGPETMFRGIRKLPPGHILELDEVGKLNIEQYWDVPIATAEEFRPRGYYVQMYRDLLEEAVAMHLMSDVPLGVFLSGGLDSSTVAALTTKIRKAPIQTFSVGYAEQAYSELPRARTVAEHLGSQHHEVLLRGEEFFGALPKLIWHEDEPIAWPSSVALYFVAQLAREHVTVVLTGEGSDETLAGYSRYPWTLWNTRLDRIYGAAVPSPLRHMVRQVVSCSLLGAKLRRKLSHTFLRRDADPWTAFYFDNFYSAFDGSMQSDLLTAGLREQVTTAYAASMSYWKKSAGELLHRLLYTDMKSYLLELLMKQDNMSMAASVESRVPFLDHVLVEFTATIPAAYLTSGLAGKCILKSAVEGLLPKAIVHQRKNGFPTPWSGWLKGAQLDRVEEVLAGGRTLDRGLFRPEGVQRLFAEHRTGRSDHASRIWRLLNLELWFRLFLDRDTLLRNAECPAVVAKTESGASPAFS